MAKAEVTVRVDIRWFRLWLFVIRLVAPILGPKRAWEWGVLGVRLIRVKCGGNRWERPFGMSEARHG